MNKLTIGLVALLVFAAFPADSQELTLLEAYRLAADNDTRLQIAGYRRDIVEAQGDQTLAQMLPSVRVFSQYSKNEVEYEDDIRPAQEYDGRRYGASLSQRLFDMSTYSQIRSANARSDGANLTLADETQLLAARVAQAYFDVLASEGRSKALSDELLALQQQVRQSDAMVKRQLVSITEQLEVTARRDLVETQYIDAENAAALAKEALYVMLGTRELLPRSLSQDFEPFTVSGNLDASIAAALALNPKVRALKAEQAAAKAGIDQVVGSALPRVDFVATRQYSDIGFDNSSSPARDTTYFGLNVNWTLVEGGAVRARAREAWANYYSAGEQLKAQQQAVEQELRSAWLGVRASQKRVSAAKRSLESAALSFHAAERAQKLGVGRVVDVLLSRSAMTRAELNLVAASADNAMAWVELHYIKGDLDEALLAEVQARL